MSKMSPEDLAAIVSAMRRDALGVEDGQLSQERAKAMDHYHGRPYGNEVEGRSAVVSNDLAEAVDWALPSIMRVFTQSGSIAEFDPIGPEDEQLAQQESDYTNQVIMRDNDGFMVLHDAIKDTLLLKNGYAKHFWEETEKVEEVPYSGLTLDQIAQMLGALEQEGAKVEITEQESTTELIDTPQGPMPVELFNLTLKVTRKSGKVTVLAVPTEEIRVSKRCRGSLQESPFTEHVTRKTRSELIEMGMPRDFVDDLPALNETDNDLQTYSRDSVSDESKSTGANIIDRSMDEIEYCEAYVRVDFDGDGIAELRKVVTVGNKIPPGKQWNEPIPAVAITGFVAKRVPHRHVGESLDDELADLAEIKTTLTRQMLDNIYLTNNNQWLVNERVNLKDFMTSLPGGVKRVKGDMPVSGAAEAVQATPIIGQILPVVDYFDRVKEGRTGLTKASTGMDPDVLKESTKGAFMENLNRASQKIEMITRLIAETGVKELVMQVHGLLCRHQDKARMVRLRGQWTNVNPQEWRERTDLTVRVGLGTGNEEQKREKLMLVAQLQQQLGGAFGLVGPEQAFSLFEDLAKTMGFDMPEKYVMSPASPQYQQMQQQRGQGPGNPLAEAEQIKGQYAMQIKQLQEQYKQQIDGLKLQFENAQADKDRASREAIEAMKAEVQLMIANMPRDIAAPGIAAGMQGM